MGVSVSEEAIRGTEHCWNDFHCLEDVESVRCEVLALLATGVLQTYCTTKSVCPYCQPAGPVYGFCVCPVRIELYTYHGV